MQNKLIHIKVTNLFGFFNHNIKIMEDGVTFIHGPNGCGKTTLLKLIASFYQWNLEDLFSVDYETIVFDYSDNKQIIVKKNYINDFIDNDADMEIKIPKLTFELFENGDIIDTYSKDRNINSSAILKNSISENLPFLRRLSPSVWIDIRNDIRYTFNEILREFSDEFPYTDKDKSPDWITQYIDSAKLHFVQTQRLLRVYTNVENRHPRDRNITEVIQLCSNDIREKISNKLADSTKVSQYKDRSFPERVLSYTLPDLETEEKIRQNYKNTEKKIEQLIKAGLIEDEKNISLPDKALEATEKRVLSLYLADINEKLSVFDDLLLRIETFLNIVTKKLRNKNLKVNRQNGFLIKTTQGKYQELKPNELSSGEQHEIVLFYELIFKTENSSIFLIDEPEISLHVDWQRQFLPDISNIAELGNHTFIIATHSPQIIGNRRDLANSLDGGILNEQ